MEHFTILKDFFSHELQSQYCKDMHYRARPKDEKLLTLLPKWEEDGLIRRIAAPSVALKGKE